MFSWRAISCRLMMSICWRSLMYSLPPLTCSYLALVSASKLATSSPALPDGAGGAGSATAVAAAAGAGVDCWISSGSACGAGRRRDWLLLLVDLAMMATPPKEKGVCVNFRVLSRLPGKLSAVLAGAVYLPLPEKRGGGIYQTFGSFEIRVTRGHGARSDHEVMRIRGCCSVDNRVLPMRPGAARGRVQRPSGLTAQPARPCGARRTRPDHDRGKVDSYTPSRSRKFGHTNATSSLRYRPFAVWGDWLSPDASGVRPRTIDPVRLPGQTGRGLSDSPLENSGKHSSDLAADGVRVGGIVDHILR